MDKLEVNNSGVNNDEVVVGLSDVDPLLGEMLAYALDGVKSYDPGKLGARLSLSHICYTMRDLINSIPDSFPSEEAVSKREV